ncbi:hypothetical protein L915_11642 [Phytophthora nicotianae]|nr:hypothetical protein L915_11642 [Phytophthora nicotianae]ETL36459.1 hypothetical protein L916_11560 [Phytophthora nicotianae]
MWPCYGDDECHRLSGDGGECIYPPSTNSTSQIQNPAPWQEKSSAVARMLVEETLPPGPMCVV